MRAGAEQPFRRDIEQVEPSGIELAPDAALLLRVEIGMQRAGGDAKLAQRRHLVVHQRDQRGDDDGGAGAAQRGHLVADAFAAAGRHQHQRVAAGQQMVDGLRLQAAEGGETEDTLQYRVRGVVRQRQRFGECRHLEVKPVNH